MTPRSFVLILLLASAAVLLAPAPLSGQAVPVSRAFSLCHDDADRSSGHYSCSSFDATALSTGGFAIASDWAFDSSEDQKLSEVGCRVDLVAAGGRLQGRSELEDGGPSRDYMPYGPFVARDGKGGFVAAWSVDEYYFTYVHLLSLGPGGELRWAILDLFSTTAERQWVTDVAANAMGRSVVVWDEGTRFGNTFRLAAQAFDTEGKAATPILLIAPLTTPPWPRPGYSPQVGMDQDGRFVVVWQEQASLFGQRFGRDGRLLGARFQIGLAGSEDAVQAMQPGGSFVVAWNEPLLLGRHLVLQWFTREGVPSGPPREVALGATAVSVALDRHGNIALLSKEGYVQGSLRLFNRDLVPQGAPRGLEFPDSLALADSGRLLVVSGHLAQVWQARHSADPCVVRDGRFLCDTAGDGGDAEASITFGQPGDIPLMGDWDGDGRADPCVYRAGRFLCDTAHDGGAPEARTPRLGVPGDRPLLADVDGNGRADACVRRGRSFLCDLDRNGTLETRIDFGKPTDVPLLADVNGDHRADPCVERAGLYLCDTARNGGAAEVIFDLNPALAGIGSGVPLLGDVDGDGRADPCLWSDGRLICGFFSRQGGVPTSILDLRFGQTGDVPVLGDLDAF